MSLYDYEVSREIQACAYPFYGIVMAAMRQADDRNRELLQHIYPDVWDELRDRYNAPGGLLRHERAMMALKQEGSPSDADG